LGREVDCQVSITVKYLLSISKRHVSTRMTQPPDAEPQPESPTQTQTQLRAQPPPESQPEPEPPAQPEPPAPAEPADRVRQVAITEELKSSYLDYAMSVIVGRALPDVRDGLKPVHRRILYAMLEGGVVSTKPHRKSARIVGDVMGRYHPHGDAAIYETIVRMDPLIDGQGNWGSIDGDSAAAMRYTEARMAKIAEEILVDINKETVDFVPNYDDSLKEPSVLPDCCRHGDQHAAAQPWRDCGRDRSRNRQP